MTTIDKIRAEIRRLYAEDSDRHIVRTSLEALSNLMDFLDTLEEPVSEDLEEAAKEFANQDCVTFISRKNGFKTGAEWMKAKMMEEAYEEEVQELYQDDDGIHCVISVGTDYKPGTIVYSITIQKEDEHERD